MDSSLVEVAPALFASHLSLRAPGLLWMGTQLPTLTCSCNYNLIELVFWSRCGSVQCTVQSR